MKNLLPPIGGIFIWKGEEKMNASIAIQVLPKVAVTGAEAGKSEKTELIRIVDEVIAYIKSTGLNYYVGPFETTVDGDYGALMEIVKNCQLICVKEGAIGVSSYVKIVYQPDEEGVWSIEEKVSKHHK